MGVQNKIIIPIYDIVDETYIWSWAELNGESEEWILDSLQHTQKERYRAKESWLILKTAIKMEQAEISEKRKEGKEKTEDKQEVNREDLGVKMLQELEKHIEGEKRNKGHKSVTEIRRGMLHSQMIGEQMKGAHELGEDTAQQPKTIELIKDQIQERKELRYKVWEAKIKRNKSLTEMLVEIGWGKMKLKRRRKPN